MAKEKTGGFTGFGEYLKEVRHACLGHPKDMRLKTAGYMETGDDSQGGFLVPEEWADDILAVAMEEAIVRPRATVINTKRDSLKVRRLVDTSRAANYFGGITFKWHSEAAEKGSNATNPVLGELELNIHKLVGGMFVSNELMDDYDSFGDFMTLSFGRALAYEEDYHYFWGTGVGQPLGIMNAGATIQHARTTGFGAPVAADLASMAGRLLPDSWQRAVWMINPVVLAGWATDATAGANAYGIIDLSSMTCLGRPIIVTDKCAASGTSGDVILADWQHYVIANRSLEISVSSETPGYGSHGFITDESFWRIVLRVDGQPSHSTAITPKLGGETLGAFVILTNAS